jgi:hypothetical protein
MAAAATFVLNLVPMITLLIYLCLTRARKRQQQEAQAQAAASAKPSAKPTSTPLPNKTSSATSSTNSPPSATRSSSAKQSSAKQFKTTSSGQPRPRQFEDDMSWEFDLPPFRRTAPRPPPRAPPTAAFYVEGQLPSPQDRLRHEMIKAYEHRNISRILFPHGNVWSIQSTCHYHCADCIFCVGPLSANGDMVLPRSLERGYGFSTILCPIPWP